MELETFVRALPKAELHLDPEGAVSATTAIDLDGIRCLPADMELITRAAELVAAFR